MAGVLVSIDAWDRIAQSRVTVRVGSARNAATLGAGGYMWEPGLPRRPRLSMQFMDDDLTGVLMTGSAEMTVDTSKITNVDPRRLDFAGAPVRIYTGDATRLVPGDYTSLANMAQVFVGKISGGIPDATTGMATFACEVNRSYFDVPLLNLTYGGGGLADGDPEIRGTYKPAGFGAPINIRPVLINAVLGIYQVDGYGNTLTIPEVFEDLASFGGPIANYANYAALAAAVIPEGRFATCIAEGLFRLGADAAGTITCDATFGGNRPGSMMLRWLQVHAGLSNTFIRTADFDALTTAVSGVAGHQTPVSHWTTDSSNVLDLIQRMCASCNAVPLLMLDGKIGVARVTGGAQIMELRRQGGTPLVTAWQAAEGPLPWWRLRMAAAKTAYVNSPSEIDYEDEIRDMGDYVPGESYRQGMVVRSTTDGARYIYINATASTGNAPPNATYWDVYNEAPDATTIKYPGGATLASKEPQEAGANKTETRTAAAIVAQGPGATASAHQVLNNVSEGSVLRIPAPVGGAWSHPAGAASGPIKVRLPVGYTNTMLRFRVSIYEYEAGLSSTYEIGGYNSDLGQWHNVFATMVGADARRRTVRFGHDSGGYCCVWIGDADSAWNHPNVRVTDFMAGYSNIAEATWSTGWIVGIEAINAASVSGTITTPNAGEAKFGTNLLESTGIVALLSAFKTVLGTAAGILGQGWGATASENAASNAVVPTGVNTIMLSSFERGTYGWTAGGGNAAISSFGVNLPNWFGKRNVIYASAAGSPTNAQYFEVTPYGPRLNSVAFMRRYSMPVKQGERIAARMLAASHRGTVELYILIHNKDGGHIETAVTSTGWIADGGGDGDNLGTMSVIHDVVSATAAYAQVMMRLTGTGLAQPYLFFAEPWLGKLAPGQTVIPPYAPGPADKMADTTLDNVSAGFTGQGVLATLSSLAYGSSLLTGFGPMAALDRARLMSGSGGIADETNSYWVTNALAITSQGTAAAISGQSYLATNYPGRLQPSPQWGDAYLAAGVVAFSQGETAQSLKPAEAGANVTEGRTAAAITGQSYLATNYPARLGPSGYGDQWLAASAMIYSSGHPVNDLRPSESGANVTEGRTAAAIASQGAFATVSTVTGSNVASYFNFNAFRLDYSITRSDGVSTVTEALAITSLGISSGIVAQGALATLSQVTTGQMAPNNAVDLQAVVPGSLNTAVQGSQASSVNLPIVLNSPNTGAAQVAVTPAINAGSFDAIFVNGSVVSGGNAGGARSALWVRRSTNGSTWTNLLRIGASGGGTIGGTIKFSFEDPDQPGSGTLYYDIYATMSEAQNLGDGPAGNNWTLSSGSIRTRKFFTK